MRETKIVNLDDQNKSVDIVMGGKTFTISRLTIQLTKLYGEYMIFCGEYAKKMAAISTSAHKEGANIEEIAVEQGLIIEEYAHKKAENIQRMLRIILEKNGYEFDQAWWEDNARYQDMEAFIFTALKKDEEDSKKKQELVAVK